MDVAVLGPLRVRVGDLWTPIAAKRQRLVFGVLLAHVGQVVTSDRLVDDVWAGAPPATGLQSLRYHVKQLRDVLTPGRSDGEPGPIGTVGSGYRLVVDPDRVDMLRFEQLVVQGARLMVDRRWDRAVEVLDQALGLWRGEAWQDFRYEAFAQPAIRRLEEQRLVCIEDRIGARLGRGEHHDLVPELRALTDRHPLHERFWAQLMIALDRAGRRGEALEVHDVARGVLGSTLGVDASPTLRRVYERIVAAPARDPDAGAGLPADRSSTLPRRRSTFIGRVLELRDLHRLLSRRRLVTITGPGGVGKSSLAIEAARRAARNARVAFVDLAPVPKGDEVTTEVVRSLRAPGLAGRATLDDAAAHVGNDTWLVLLDNCEHVLDGVAHALDELLATCPALTVVATSRRALRVDGEHVLPLEPMALPATSRADDARRSDAVRLFVDRAAAARGRFTLTAENQHQVVELCRRLDALPLALELAAARLRVIDVDELLGMLDAPLDVLVDGTSGDPRHQTLLATMRWSYDLLSEDAASLLRCLSVFRGSIDLEAARSVCVGDVLSDDAVLVALTELVDNSLVQHRDGERLALLDTVREFADQQITDEARREELRERHAGCFAERVGRHTDYGSADQLAIARRVKADADDAAAALAWAVGRGRRDLALPLLAGAATYWYGAPHGNEQLRWLAHRLAETDLTVSPEYASALCSLGLSLPSMGLLQEARAVAGRLEQLATQLDHPERDADALWVRAAIATVAGDIRTSRDLFARGAALLRAIDHPKLSVFLFDLARRELQLGDVARATSLTDELQALATTTAQPLSEARAVLMHGRIAHHWGDVRRGIVESTRALARIRQLGLSGPQVDPIIALCEMAATTEDWDLGERMSRELMELLANNGEIASQPIAHATLALVALARDDDEIAAGRRVADGLSLMLDTGAYFPLDHVLVACIRILTAVGRHHDAADVLAMRNTRSDFAGTADPTPLQWLLATRHDGHGPSSARSSPQSAPMSDELIATITLHLLPFAGG